MQTLINLALIPGRNNPDLNLNDHLQTLSDKMEQLGSKADDIQCQVRNEELQPSKKTKSEVTLWLKQVEEIKQDFESIKADVLLVVENRDTRKSRQLFTEMKGMMEQVFQLLKQGEFSQGLVLEDLKPEGIHLVTTKLEGSKPFTVKDNVLSAFIRGKSRVGVFGMGGVGKTTVAMHLNNDILSGCTDCFKHVFYVTVSRGSTIHKLQQDISTALTLTLKDTEDETRRAAELSDSLKKRDKSLLILDDIWEYIPMEKVGVAVEGDGCKLLITTRKRDVCRKMSCDTMVKMKPLPRNEAWDLFVSKLGNYESLNDATKCVARSIAEECAGLPLAIITMASCMRGECDEREWRYTLKQLRNPYSNHDDMDSKVFNILKHSYERLSNDKLRECLKYCALFLEWYKPSRNTSIVHFIAVALLRNEGTRKETIDEGHHMLKALADASLLEFTTYIDGHSTIKMHDLIRDMAVKIIGSKGIVKPGKGLKEMPRKEEWTQDLILVSLMGNWIKGIEDEICPECPNLSVLILCGNVLRNIPHSFFVHMKGLRYLDLSYTLIVKLPYSIANLCNLDALMLEGCSNLDFIPSVAKLSKLRDLNVSGTRVEALPVGVEELINLKYLDITRTRIRSIPEGILCRLCKLESFQGRIDDFNAFKQFVGSDKFDRLERYSIVVGEPNDIGGGVFFYASKRERRILIRNQCQKYEFGEFFNAREVEFKVPHSIQFLELQLFHFGAECLLDALPSLCAARELEKCHLAYCKGIKYIISKAGFDQRGCNVSTPGKGVQQLELIHLDDFVGLYEGEAVHPHIFFGGLRELRIVGCPNVKKIWLQNDILPNLESIHLDQCGNMEEVFATTVGATLEFPCLKTIELLLLSKLRSICENNVFLPSLEKVRVSLCPKLEKLWSGMFELPSLEHVSLQRCNQMKEIIATKEETRTTIKGPKLSYLNLEDLPELKRICRNTVFFPQLQYLQVWGCPKLKSLGLLNENMQCLRRIWIAECAEMEEIFDGWDGVGDDAIQLPNLNYMYLERLPELRSICRKAIVCNSVESVTIKGEDKLGNWPISVPRLLTSNTNPSFPTLEAVDKPKDWWNSLRWNDPTTKLAFQQLGILRTDNPFKREMS